jgi:hypothetical protein
LLVGLLARAEAGDTAAAEALIRLGLQRDADAAAPAPSSEPRAEPAL